MVQRGLVCGVMWCVQSPFCSWNPGFDGVPVQASTLCLLLLLLMHSKENLRRTRIVFCWERATTRGTPGRLPLADTN